MTDDRIRELILPVRIIASGGDISNIGKLLKKDDLQIGINEKDTAVMKAGSFVLLDFGKEMNGGARILYYYGKNAALRVRFGESASEAMTDSGVKEADNYHSQREFLITPDDSADFSFGETGFRFMRIDIFENKTGLRWHGAETEVSIKNIYAVSVSRKLKEIGSFECDDELVNKIYRTAADTLKLCMQDYLWDGIKRDRLVWAGDMHPEILAVNCLFGKDKCVEKSFDYLAKTYPLPQFINNIPTYSMWWLICLREYHLQNKNTAFLHKQKKYISELIKMLNGMVDDNGSYTLSWPFVDWQTEGTEDAKTGSHVIFMWAVRSAASVLRIIGESVDICSELSAKLAKRKFDKSIMKQIAALMQITGGMPWEEARNILQEGGANGLSTFMSGYILTALVRSGEGKASLEIMKEYFGAMLNLGATTFWEDFDIEWTKGEVCPIDRLPEKGEKDIHGDFGKHCYSQFRHSLCHGWASGPVPFLTYVVLGVRVLEDGCKAVEIKPDLCGLKQVRGTYPTPYGVIKIEHALQLDGSVQSKIEAPPEVDIVR